MLNLFLVLAIPAWFTMLYPVVRRRLAAAVRPLDARLVLPMVLGFVRLPNRAVTSA